MAALTSVSLSLLDVLALIGLAQSLSILVYVVLRVRQWRQALPVVFYALAISLGCAFTLSLRLPDGENILRAGLWTSWGLACISAYLLVLQLASLPRKSRAVSDDPQPSRISYALFLLVPFVGFVAHLPFFDQRECGGFWPSCTDFRELTALLVSVTTALTFLLLWRKRDLFDGLRAGAEGRERYWLVITLLATNLGMAVVFLLQAQERLAVGEVDLLLVTLGLAALYLAASSLFRVYPLAIDLEAEPRLRLSPAPVVFSQQDKVYLSRIRELMDVQKVYHEQTFSRTDLARELNCSESVLSRLINQAYGKSLPRLLNEYRVEDAKRLLATSDSPIQVVAFEVGFNSLASFNRVFKEIEGQPPSSWRESVRATEGLKNQA